MFIASPGRFVFGVVICLELILLICINFLFSYLSKKLDLSEFNNVFSLVGLVFFACLYKQIVSIFFPIIALSLSFVFFLPVVTSFVIGISTNAFIEDLQKSFSKSVKFSVFFSLYALFIYLIRDILGYGTITYFAKNGFGEIILLNDTFTWTTFFASIPGALFIVCVSILLFLIIQNKFKIIQRAGLIDVSR